MIAIAQMKKKSKTLSVETWFNAIGLDIQTFRHVQRSYCLHDLATYLHSRLDLQSSQPQSHPLPEPANGCQLSEVLSSLTSFCQQKFPKS